MSNAYAFADDASIPVSGPSTVMSWLRALGQKLHRLALAIKEKAVAAFHAIKKIPRVVADFTMSTVSTVVSHSGFQTAVSLLVAGGQVLRLVVTSGLRRIAELARRLLAWAAPAMRSLADQPRARDWTRAASRWATNPWIGGALILVVMVAALLASLLRRRFTRAAEDAHDEETARLSDHEVEQVMARMFVVISADGSILVHGIPMTLTTEQRVAVAHVAATAATDHLHRLVRRGRPISTADLQAINLRARSAVAAEFGDEGRAA